MTAKTATAMSEEQMVHLVRNALLVAGQEMGKGDQWPVIKDTVYKIMKDWEDLKVERNVDDELKTHYLAIIKDLADNLHECPQEMRPKAEQMIRDLYEIYTAHFEPAKSIEASHDDLPLHMQRMFEIIKTLEE